MVRYRRDSTAVYIGHSKYLHRHGENDNAVDSRYYELCYNDILLITMLFQYHRQSQIDSIYIGYFKCLDTSILFSHLNSIVIPRVYSIVYKITTIGSVTQQKYVLIITAPYLYIRFYISSTCMLK